MEFPSDYMDESSTPPVQWPPARARSVPQPAPQPAPQPLVTAQRHKSVYELQTQSSKVQRHRSVFQPKSSTDQKSPANRKSRRFSLFRLKTSPMIDEKEAVPDIKKANLQVKTPEQRPGSATEERSSQEPISAVSPTTMVLPTFPTLTSLSQADADTSAEAPPAKPTTPVDDKKEAKGTEDEAVAISKVDSREGSTKAQEPQESTKPEEQFVMPMETPAAIITEAAKEAPQLAEKPASEPITTEPQSPVEKADEVVDFEKPALEPATTHSTVEGEGKDESKDFEKEIIVPKPVDAVDAPQSKTLRKKPSIWARMGKMFSGPKAAAVH